MGTLNLLIIEKHTAVRKALAIRLRSVATIQTVASIEEARELLKAERPNVILYGLQHNQNGNLRLLVHEVAALAQPGTAVLILTSYADDIEHEALLHAGAARYLLKNIDTPRLIREIETAVDGVSSRRNEDETSPSSRLDVA